MSKYQNYEPDADECSLVEESAREQSKTKRAVSTVGRAGQVEKLPTQLDWPTYASKNKPHGGSIDNVLYFCDELDIQAKLNEFDGRVYVCLFEEDQELSDKVVVQIMRMMHKCGCIVGKSTVSDALLALAVQKGNRFHPVREYLDCVQPDWDKIKRLDKLVPYYLNAADTPLNRAMGRKWMIAGVRRTRKPGTKFDAILTLRGEQGTGKSTFFRLLGTPRGMNLFSDSMDVGAGAKETIESMSGVWVAEFPELSKLNAKEVEQVKRAASAQVDRARLNYDKYSSVVPRQFVCGATVNEEHFLRDPTGNRRFWVVEVGLTREKELTPKVIDQLWAEAAHYEALGEDHNLPPELWSKAAEAAERHMKEDPVAESVFLALSALPKKAVVVPTSEVAQAIGLDDVTRRGGQIAQSMAAGAKRAGWTVKLGRVPGLQTAGGVRHYASPQSKRGTPTAYKFSRASSSLVPVAVLAKKPLRSGRVRVTVH